MKKNKAIVWLRKKFLGYAMASFFISLATAWYYATAQAGEVNGD